MNWLLTAALCVLMVEFALRLPLAGALSGVRRAGGKAVHVLSAKGISDHWKEKAMGAYAKMTFISTMKLCGLLIAFLAVAAALVFAFDAVQNGFEAFILDWAGLGASLVFASAYFYIRGKIVR